MLKKINLYWYKLNDGSGNFGDELNHYIVERLSGRKVNRILIPSSGYDYIYKSLKFLYYRVLSIKYLPLILKQFFINDFIIGIGSVISVHNSSKAKIWGSGIMKKDALIKRAEFFAVRGKYTQNRLRELNLDVPEVTGDPALLLPILYKKQTIESHILGIVPHFTQFNDIKNKIKDKTILVIDLTEPIEKVIDDITSCRYIVSTSLHGIIVAHAYDIPSLWYLHAEINMHGDNIKFYDYFSSVGIKEYEPFKLIPELLEVDQVVKLFNDFVNLSLINVSIIDIQQKLIKVAPFPVLEKYRI